MNEHEQRIRDTLHAIRSVAPETSDRIAEDLTSALSAARAEALDCVARVAEHRAFLARRVYVGTDKAPAGEGAGDALETLAADIRSGAPAPASVPVEVVREVLASLGMGAGAEGSEEYDKACADVAAEALRRLGVPLDAVQDAKAPITHRRSGAQWATCGANGPSTHLSSNPTDVTCEDARCKVTPTLLDAQMPRQCGGCAHRIHAPGYCIDTYCVCRWTP